MISKIQLRRVEGADLLIFFQNQLDTEANHMAAFTAKNPADREAFNAHWAKIMADESIVIRTILFHVRVAGYILSHGWFGDLEVSYWIGKEIWGRGIATQALKFFLDEQPERPIYARAVHDNAASLRVLEKCGFVVVSHERGFANARDEEVEEVILKLSE